MKKNEFLTFVKQMFAHYGREPNKFSYDVWISMGDEFGFDCVKQAIEAHAKNPDNGHFMPQPAHITAMVKGTSKERASIAWSKLTSILDRASAREFVFDDPIIHLAIESMGGMHAVAKWRYEDLSFRETEFTNHYNTIAKLPALPSYPKLMSACGEGKWIKEPVGDTSKARLVFLGKTEARHAINQIKKH